VFDRLIRATGQVMQSACQRRRTRSGRCC